MRRRRLQDRHTERQFRRAWAGLAPAGADARGAGADPAAAAAGPRHAGAADGASGLELRAAADA